MRPPTDNALVLGNLREYRHKRYIFNENTMERVSAQCIAFRMPKQVVMH